MGGRLEIRKNIPRKLTRIRKTARRCVNQLGKLTRARNITAQIVNRNNFYVNQIQFQIVNFAVIIDLIADMNNRKNIVV